jgi:6-phosphogluconolactonase/glucosamine-6-phosphate isomerase/deaminase
MMNELQQVLRERNVLIYENSGVKICRVEDEQAGFGLAEEILYRIVDRRTVVYLSGGKTPKGLYKNLAKDERIAPGAVGLVDERYGERFHANSNEKMLKESGLLRYLEIVDIPFYPILRGGMSREETAEAYDVQMRLLQNTFVKHVGILGIGADGHTAGIPAGNLIMNHELGIYDSSSFVVEYDDGVKYGERVSMSFLGLSMLDVLLVLVFGEEKRQALELVFGEGREEDVPGRFFKRKEIAERTLLITDQET